MSLSQLFSTIFLLSISHVFAQTSSEVSFTILHINDMHARVEGMKGSGGCSTSDKENFECDGGWSKMLSAAKQFVSESTSPVIFIDNGDQFSGTIWSTFYQGDEVHLLKNKFCQDAGFAACFTGLGNHEFDFGYDRVLNYVQQTEHDVIVSNLRDNCDLTSGDDPKLGDLLKRSLVLNITGVSVGFVGYVTSETPTSSSPPDCLEFLLEEDAIEIEVNALKADGVQVIVVIGHSGIDRDVEIATAFADIDIIVGGHSHTFLWDEDTQGQIPAQSFERAQDTPVTDYPLLTPSDSIPIVQAFFGSRYLGAISLEFNAEGSLENFQRKSVILSDKRSEDIDGSTEGFEPDAGMEQLVDSLFQPLLEFVNEKVGSVPRDLSVNVDGSRRIRQAEMPIGNFACDAMLSAAQKVNNEIVLCMQNGGGIRADLPAGDLTFNEVINVFPFANTLSFLRMNGRSILRAIEFGLENLPAESGSFLHFSKGFEMFYDPREPALSRVINASLNGELILNDDSQSFGIVTNSFIAAGGGDYLDSFTSADVELLLATGENQEDSLATYIAENPQLCQTTEGRINPIQNPIDVATNEELDLLGLEFDDCAVRFRILHINDMHARVQGMRGTGGCSTEQNNNAECDGGWGRLMDAGKRFVDESDGVPVIFINNGDQFSGTVWSTFYQGNESFIFMNQLCETRENGGAGFFLCLSGIGNHEFDFGYDKLSSFAQNLKHQIINSNIEDNCEGQELGDNLNKHLVVEIQGKQVGFVGYVLPETENISSAPNCVDFVDEEIALNSVISELDDIDLLIAIGHSGITKDLQLAQAIPELDLIVGGHSHTFLWNENAQGSIPSQSRSRTDGEGILSGLRKDSPISDLDVYPRFASGDDSESTPVLQAYFGSRYLGGLDVIFDFDGNLQDFTRQTVLLANENSIVAGATDFNATEDPPLTIPDNSPHAFKEDPLIMDLVEELLQPLEAFIEIDVGELAVTLATEIEGGIGVRTSEMPLGNFVCDAMMNAFNLNPDGIQVEICLQNGGGIRASLEAGKVNFGQVIDVHPFSNVLSVLEFTGERLYNACEKSVEEIGNGRFLHFGSGFQMNYNPRNEVGSRVLNLTLDGNLIQRDDLTTYTVVTNSFLAAGGDGYGAIFSEANVLLATGENQEDALADEILRRENGCAEIERRIVAVENPVNGDQVEIDVINGVEQLTRCDEIPPNEDEDASEDNTDDLYPIIGAILVGCMILIMAVVTLYDRRTSRVEKPNQEEEERDGKVEDLA